MARKFGTDFPDKVDMVTVEDGVCYFYVVQGHELDGERTLALQTKLNNYLAYILDGQLEQDYPERTQLQKVIRVELLHKPEGVAAEFLEKVAPHIKKEGIGFEVNLYSEDDPHDV